jgi:hypothetical protein
MFSVKTFCKLKPFPRFCQHTGPGFGLAACPSLNLLVTSDINHNTLSVWSLPTHSSAGGLELAYTLGGSGGSGGSGGGSAASPIKFKFNGMDTGCLAFIPPISSDAHCTLLVTDAGANAVHFVDVVRKTHEGYLAPPGSITRPRGVAASPTSPMVAVSVWKAWRKEKGTSADHVILLYRRTSEAVWERVREIGGGFCGGRADRDGQLRWPFGLRFTRDGSAILVADCWNRRASVFRVDDGGFVRHIATGLSLPYDVEEVEGGWLVACDYSCTVVFVGDGDDVGGDRTGGRPSLGKVGGEAGSMDGQFRAPVALATVPGLGLVVRENPNDRLQVFATQGTKRKWGMSTIRLAWMSAVIKATLARCVF